MNEANKRIEALEIEVECQRKRIVRLEEEVEKLREAFVDAMVALDERECLGAPPSGRGEVGAIVV